MKSEKSEVCRNAHVINMASLFCFFCLQDPLRLSPYLAFSDPVCEHHIDNQSWSAFTFVIPPVPKSRSPKPCFRHFSCWITPPHVQQSQIKWATALSGDSRSSRVHRGVLFKVLKITGPKVAKRSSFGDDSLPSEIFWDDSLAAQPKCDSHSKLNELVWSGLRPPLGLTLLSQTQEQRAASRWNHWETPGPSSGELLNKLPSVLLIWILKLTWSLLTAGERQKMSRPWMGCGRRQIKADLSANDSWI